MQLETGQCRYDLTRQVFDAAMGSQEILKCVKVYGNCSSGSSHIGKCRQNHRPAQGTQPKDQAVPSSTKGYASSCTSFVFSEEASRNRRGSVRFRPCLLTGRFVLTGSYRYSGLLW